AARLHYSFVRLSRGFLEFGFRPRHYLPGYRCEAARDERNRAARTFGLGRSLHADRIYHGLSRRSDSVARAKGRGTWLFVQALARAMLARLCRTRAEAAGARTRLLSAIIWSHPELSSRIGNLSSFMGIE